MSQIDRRNSKQSQTLRAARSSIAPPCTARSSSVALRRTPSRSVSPFHTPARPGSVAWKRAPSSSTSPFCTPNRYSTCSESFHYRTPEAHSDLPPPSPVSPTILGFVSRERSRLSNRFLELHSLLLSPSTRHQRRRAAVTEQYGALVLDVLDEWDASFTRLVDTLELIEVEYSGVPRKGWLRDLVEEEIGNAIDEYLGVRFRAQEELDELDATWSSMMRLVR